MSPRITGTALSLAADMYRDGRTHEEIGALMGWPETTTNYRLRGRVKSRSKARRRKAEHQSWHRIDESLRGRCIDCKNAYERERRKRRRG